MEGQNHKQKVKEQTKLPDALLLLKSAKWKGRVMWLEPQITGQILSRVGHQRAKERGRPKTRWVDDIRSLNNNWMSSAQDRKKWSDQKKAFIQQWTNDG